MPKITRNKSEELSFAKFLDFLVGVPVEEFDDHWIPQSFHCRPDLISYDAILKVENLRQDFFTHFGKRLNGKIPKSNSQFHHYYDSIPPRTMKKLLKIYQKDFKMFNYSLPLVP